MVQLTRPETACIDLDVDHRDPPRQPEGVLNIPPHHIVILLLSHCSTRMTERPRLPLKIESVEEIRAKVFEMGKRQGRARLISK
jgi:hypothetical protein